MIQGFIEETAVVHSPSPYDGDSEKKEGGDCGSRSVK